MSAVDADGIATRHPDLVLARLHLRLGSLALARAELETLAGQDALDGEGLVDLAEARWRWLALSSRPSRGGTRSTPTASWTSSRPAGGPAI